MPEVLNKSTADLARSRSGLAGWLMALVLLVFLVIVWGGFVRLTGSGLSIPDWPLINGSLLPPFSDSAWQAVYDSYHQEVYSISALSLPTEMPMGQFKTMFAIEYIHRSLAAIVGIVFLVAFIKSVRQREIWRQTRILFVSAAILLVGQAVLGGVVVKQELQAELVAIHLGIAFVFLSVLLWMALKLSVATEFSPEPNKKLIRLSWFAIIALWIQVVIGGLTAGTKAGMIFNTFPKMGDYLIPPPSTMVSRLYGGFFANLAQNQILIQFLHRWWAFVVLAFIVVLIVKGIKTDLSPRGRVALRLVGTITVFQILWGILNLLLKVPAWVSSIHLGTALLIFALLILIAHESRYKYAPATV